jgi:hypothetical protein
MAPGKASASATARERARASLTAGIKEAARSQLAAVGADALSLRAAFRWRSYPCSAKFRRGTRRARSVPGKRAESRRGSQPPRAAGRAQLVGLLVM